MLDKKFTVHVARESGHEQELMTREDIVEMVSANENTCLLYTSPSPRDLSTSRMPSSA